MTSQPSKLTSILADTFLNRYPECKATLQLPDRKIIILEFNQITLLEDIARAEQPVNVKELDQRLNSNPAIQNMTRYGEHIIAFEKLGLVSVTEQGISILPAYLKATTVRIEETRPQSYEDPGHFDVHG